MAAEPDARPFAVLVAALGLGLVALLVVGSGSWPPPVAAPAAVAAPVSAAPVSAAPVSAAPVSAAPVSAAPVSAAPAAAPVEPSAAPVPALRPTGVYLPTLGVRSALVDLDVAPDGALATPADPDLAGWYVRGAVPGEPGPAVIAGHVDSRSGPAVFHRLDELRADDRVEVTRSDGRTVAYRVVTVASFPKAAFPTARVYGPTPAPELRLITCGGEFDRRSRHYEDNVVVTAVLAG